ncbi:MAG: Mg-chelatase subunit ChlD [Bacteroidia bacterium]
MLRATIILFLCLITHIEVCAQQLIPNPYDFGKTALWNNPKATLSFTNTLTKPVLFLPMSYQRNLYVNLPEGYIQPGQTVQIEAIYYTEDRGNFQISQPIYISGSNNPMYLNLKGKITSFHPDAHMACPSYRTENNKANPSIASIKVIHGITGETLTSVDIVLTGPSKNYFIERTKHDVVELKDLPIGLYQLELSKSGFVSKHVAQYINMNTGLLVFELFPIKDKELPPMVKVDPPKEVITREGTDQVVEITKPDRTEQEDIEKLRKLMDEKYKDRKIIEQDVLVLTETTDSTTKITPEIKKEDIADFDETGTLNPSKYASNNIVFLIDVSSSMQLDNKLVNLQTSMTHLVDVLRAQDLVSIVIYSSKARVVLEPTSGDQKVYIKSVIDALVSRGLSKGAEGLAMAYKEARSHFIPGGNNQIILASDGKFNSRETSEKDLFELAKNQAEEDIKTSVVGFGKDVQALNFMQLLALNGNGGFVKINDENAANAALIKEVMRSALR